MRGKITQQEIAEKAGVSRALVTHALNGTRHSRISEETRRTIQRVARELNYRPRSLTTHNIGYLLPIDNAYLEAEHTFSLQVERAARLAGYRLITFGVQDESELDSLPETFNAKTVDGVIAPRWYDGKIRHALPPEVPLLVVADDDHIAPEVDVVSTDARATIRAMTQYLLDYGHERIGVVLSASDEVKQHRDIVQGGLDALRDNRLSDDHLVFTRGVVEGVVASMKEVLAGPEVPTAWIAASSTYATAVFLGLYARGYQIPQNVSMMSFFDSPSFQAFPVPLTATTAFGVEVAEKAMERLVAKIEREAGAPLHQSIAARIIERASVAAPQRVVK